MMALLTEQEGLQLALAKANLPAMIQTARGGAVSA
jgi:hypothetical protein